MIKIEKKEVQRKKSKLVPNIILVISLVLVMLAYLIDFYPGGYSVKEVENGIIVKKGIFTKESYTFTTTTQNELHVSLVNHMTKQLKFDWYSSVLSVGAILMGVNNFINRNRRTVITILLTVTILLSILLYLPFSKSISFINDLILTLNQK